MHEAEQHSRSDEPDGGNSYEVAVHKAVEDAAEGNSDVVWWEVTEVFVRTGNPHIKEYKVNVVPSGGP